MQPSQLPLGCAHMLGPAALSGNNACLQTPVSHGSSRGMLSCRLQSVRGGAVLPTVSTIDFLRNPQLA